jgi:hypothetical protein
MKRYVNQTVTSLCFILIATGLLLAPSPVRGEETVNGFTLSADVEGLLSAKRGYEEVLFEGTRYIVERDTVILDPGKHKVSFERLRVPCKVRLNYYDDPKRHWPTLHRVQVLEYLPGASRKVWPE